MDMIIMACFCLNLKSAQYNSRPNLTGYMLNAANGSGSLAQNSKGRLKIE